MTGYWLARRLKGLRWLWIALSVGLTLFIAVQDARAFKEDDCTITYRSGQRSDRLRPQAEVESNANGQLDGGLMIFECTPGYASARDRVIVYSKGHPLAPHRPWRENVTFEDEVWVFDAEADGTANLIIDFYRIGSELIADLYDDQDGDAQVAYRLQQGWPVITESAFWTVQLRAPDGWWAQGGTLNFNLDIAVDGSVMAMASFDRFLGYFETDGDVDFYIKVRDLDHSGRGDYDFRWSDTPLPKSWGVRRVNLAVEEKPVDPERALPAAYFSGKVFWPYLGTVYGPLRYADGTLILVPYKDLEARRYGFIQGYNQPGSGGLMPPIQIGWQKAKIVFVAEFVPSRGGERNWFIYALPPYQPGSEASGALGIPTPSPYRADFENPFGFYDMAGDGDGIPELLVRIEGYPEDDVYSPIRGRPFSSVRFSWDQDNDGAWEYTVNLHGVLDLATQTLMVDTIPIVSVPYAELPERVLSQTWDHISLVSHMDGGFVGMEGMYVWGMPYALRDEYFSGIVDEPPLDEFQQIPRGYRGEVALRPGLQARLYFSPIDCALHLVDAKFGIWNLDDHGHILYKNLDEDAYLDHWRYVRDGQVEQDLYVAKDYLVYQSRDRVAIQRLDDTVSFTERTFEVAPPHNRVSWSALTEALGNRPCASDRDAMETEGRRPYDFPVKFTQDGLSTYDDPDWVVEGARLRDFQHDPQGFRFVLDLQPGFYLGEPGGPLLESVSRSLVLSKSGQHQQTSVGVIYDREAGFEVIPLRLLRPGVDSITVTPNPPVEYAPAVVEASIRMEGEGVQMRSVPITLYVQSETGGPMAVETVKLTLRANESRRTQFSWTPQSAGRWRIWLVAGRALNATSSAGGSQREGQVRGMMETEIEVQSALYPTLAWSLGLANDTGDIGNPTLRSASRLRSPGEATSSDLWILVFFGALGVSGGTVALLFVRQFKASKSVDPTGIDDYWLYPHPQAVQGASVGSWEDTVPILSQAWPKPLAWLAAVKPAHIFVLALFVRGIYTFVAPQVDPFLQRDPLLGDAGSYDRIIRSLLAGGGYRQLDLIGPHFPQPDVFWPPLYPLMMAGVYQVLIVFEGLGYNLLAGRLFHALLGAIVPVVVYFIGRAMFSLIEASPRAYPARDRASAVASLAGLGIAFYPYLIYFGAWLIADGPYMLLLSLTLLTAVALQRSFKIRGFDLGHPQVSGRPQGVGVAPTAPFPYGRPIVLAAILGVLLGLDILMKPTTLMLLPPFLFWFLFALGGVRGLNKGRWMARLALGFVTLVVMLGVIAPWTLRNYGVTGDWVLVSVNGGYTFYGANNPDAFGGHREGFPVRDPQKSPVIEEREFYRRALTWIRENPRDFLALVPKKLLRLFSPLAVASLEEPYPLPFAGWVYLLYGLFLTLAFWGLVRSMAHWRAFSVLYIPVLGVLLSTVLFYGDTRYSLPMVPSLVLFAAKAVVDLLTSSDLTRERLMSAREVNRARRPYR